MNKNISWRVNKYNEWHDICINSLNIVDTNRILKENLKDKNILFLDFLFKNKFEKHFPKLDIKHKIYSFSNDKIFASISFKDVDFLNDISTYYEYCFVEVPASISENQIEKIPKLNCSELLFLDKYDEIIPILNSLDNVYSK